MRYATLLTISLLLVLAMLLTSCSSKSRQWYKEGYYQADFDKDVRECEIVAREFARRATLTGKREDPVVYADTLNNCLYRKGWSHQPPPAPHSTAAPADEATPSAAALARYEEGRVQGFGKTINLPPGFNLLVDISEAPGPTVNHTLFFGGEGPTFINIIFQRAINDRFAPTPYPVKEPFFLYEEGRPAAGNDHHWALFAGRFQGEWVSGYGMYILAGKRERIMVAITTPLPPPSEPPPPGLQLDHDQYRAMEEFRQKWRTWAAGEN